MLCWNLNCFFDLENALQCNINFEIFYSILIVYKSLNNIREGLSPIDSVKFAVQKRIRPIFMTTLSTSFGLLPLAIIPGAGAELYRGLAVIILSGLLISTFFTLFLTPMAIITVNRFFKIK